MENILKYYEFSDFFKDASGTFSEKLICFSEINSKHFLIFAKDNETYNLYVSKYRSKKDIGQFPPEIIETLVQNYDKSIPEHRVAIKRYLV